MEKTGNDFFLMFIILLTASILLSACVEATTNSNALKKEEIVYYVNEGDGIFIIPNRKGQYDLAESLKVLKRENPERRVVSVVLEVNESNSKYEEGWIVITENKPW